MSVKVVSPTDPGQPELPMSLRPQPAPAAPRRGRSRQCVSPGPAADSRQPQLPISLCTSAAELPRRSSPVAADWEQPEADSGQSERAGYGH